MSMRPAYIKIILVVLLGMTFPHLGYSQTGTISIKTVSDTSICAGDSVYVGYDITDSFNANNVMRVQLSNASGNFLGGGTTIIGGEVRYKGSGLIACVVPPSVPPGMFYQVRIFADGPPSYFSPPYQDSLHIYNRPISGAFVDGPVCVGDSLKLRDTGSTLNANYVWTGPFTYFDRDPVVLNVQLNSTGNYMLTATSGACVTQSSVFVKVDSTPQKPVISSLTSACIGDSLKFSIAQTPGASYAWSGPAGFSPTAPNPNIPNVNTTHAGVYIVTATMTNCVARDTQFVTVSPKPKKPEAVVLNTVVCAGKSLSLRVDSTTTGAAYNWTGPLTSGVQNPVFNNVNTTHSGDYVVTASLGTCSASDTVTVIVNPTPVLPTTSFEGGCTGDTLKLIAVSIVGAGTYIWFNTAGYIDSSIGGIATRPNALTTFSGTYFVSMRSQAGCVSDTASVNVTITDAPAVPVITNNSPICAGRNLELNATSATPGVTYNWSGPNGFSFTGQNVFFPGIQPDMSGSYTVTVTLGSCAETTDTKVDIKPFNTPAVTISADPGIEVARMTPITFMANALNAGTSPKYQWKRNGQDIAGATNEMFNAVAGVDVLDNDYISVMVKSNADCPLPDSIMSYIFAVDVNTDINNINVVNKLLIHPDHTYGTFWVTGIINTNDPVEMRVINVAGDLVLRTTGYPVNKTINHPIQIPEVAAGVYLLQLKAGEQVINLRFVKGN